MTRTCALWRKLITRVNNDNPFDSVTEDLRTSQRRSTIVRSLKSLFYSWSVREIRWLVGWMVLLI